MSAETYKVVGLRISKQKEGGGEEWKRHSVGTLMYQARYDPRSRPIPGKYTMADILSPENAYDWEINKAGATEVAMSIVHAIRGGVLTPSYYFQDDNSVCGADMRLVHIINYCNEKSKRVRVLSKLGMYAKQQGGITNGLWRTLSENAPVIMINTSRMGCGKTTKTVEFYGLTDAEGKYINKALFVTPRRTLQDGVACTHVQRASELVCENGIYTDLIHSTHESPTPSMTIDEYPEVKAVADKIERMKRKGYGHKNISKAEKELQDTKNIIEWFSVDGLEFQDVVPSTSPKESQARTHAFLKSGKSLSTTLYSQSQSAANLLEQFTKKERFDVVLEEFSVIIASIAQALRNVSFDVVNPQVNNFKFGIDSAELFTNVSGFDYATLGMLKNLKAVLTHKNLRNVVINDADLDVTGLKVLQALMGTSAFGNRNIVIAGPQDVQNTLWLNKNGEKVAASREAEVITTKSSLLNLNVKDDPDQPVCAALFKISSALDRGERVCCYVPNQHYATKLVTFLDALVKPTTEIRGGFYDRISVKNIALCGKSLVDEMLKNNLVVHTNAIASGVSLVHPDGDNKYLFDLSVYFVDAFVGNHTKTLSGHRSLSHDDIVQMVWRDRSAHNVMIINSTKPVGGRYERVFNGKNSEFHKKFAYAASLAWFYAGMTGLTSEHNRLFYQDKFIDDVFKPIFANGDYSNLDEFVKCMRVLIRNTKSDTSPALSENGKIHLRNSMLVPVVGAILAFNNSVYDQSFFEDKKFEEAIDVFIELMQTHHDFNLGSIRLYNALFNNKDQLYDVETRPERWGLNVSVKLADTGFKVKRYNDSNYKKAVIPQLNISEEVRKAIMRTVLKKYSNRRSSRRYGNFLSASNAVDMTLPIEEDRHYEIPLLQTMSDIGLKKNSTCRLNITSMAHIKTLVSNSMESSVAGIEDKHNVVALLRDAYATLSQNKHDFDVFMFNLLLLESVDKQWYQRKFLRDTLREHDINVYTQLVTSIHQQSLLHTLCFGDTHKINSVRAELRKQAYIEHRSYYKSMTKSQVAAVTDRDVANTLEKYMFDTYHSDATKTYQLSAVDIVDSGGSMISMDVLSDAQAGRMKTRSNIQIREAVKYLIVTYSTWAATHVKVFLVRNRNRSTQNSYFYLTDITGLNVLAGDKNEEGTNDNGRNGELDSNDDDSNEVIKESYRGLTVGDDSAVRVC